MSFGETLYYLMYELLSPYGMEDSAYVRRVWDSFPFGDLPEDEKNAIQAAFEEVLQEIVSYLNGNRLTIADLMENGKWKTGNEDFIGLLSQLAGSMNATYNSADGTILFADSTSQLDSNGIFPFMAVAETSTDTNKEENTMANAYLVTYKALITEADIKGGYANKNGTINFAGLDKKAENVAAAAGQNVTAAEFKALLDALVAAGLMKPATEG